MESVEYDGDGMTSFINAQDSYFANLDLRLWLSNSDGESELVAQSVSDYNNVEHLFLNLEDSGRYALEVYFDDMVYGDVQTETFALAWNLAQVPEPAQVSIWLSLLAASFAIFVRARNRSDKV